MLNQRQQEYLWSRLSPVFSDMLLDGIEQTKTEFLRKLNLILDDIPEIKRTKKRGKNG